MIGHQRQCKGKSEYDLTIGEMLECPGDAIPLQAEKAAANIIKLKLKRQSDTRVILPSGSSRVSSF